MTAIETANAETPGRRGRAATAKPSWLVLATSGRRVLDEPPTAVETVSLGDVFLRLLHDRRPELAVVSVPPGGPNELVAAVSERRRRPGLRLILLNEPEDVTGRLAALAQGFDEALPASIDPAELSGRARILLEQPRPAPLAERQVSIARGVVLDLAGRRVHRDGKEVRLRPKEFSLLALLATDPGRVFTRDELVERIWGRMYTGGARTVDVHIRWLRAKIEDDPARPAHVVTVRGAGYRLDPPAAEPRVFINR